jgi:hypothetical protein
MRIRMGVVVGAFTRFFPRGGVDSEDPVDRTESATCAEDWKEAEKTPPAETVHAEEENAAAEEETHPGVIRAYVCFHGMDWV